MFFVLIVITSPDPPNTQDSSSTSSLFSRLEGRWRVVDTSAKRSIRTAQIEAWRLMSDGSLKGWSGTSHGTGIRKDEDREISFTGVGWTYSSAAIWRNQGTSISYECTLATDRALWFENTGTGFPQKIEYLFIDQDSLVVTASGEGRSVTRNYRRIPKDVYAYTYVMTDDKGHFARQLPEESDPSSTIARLLGRWAFDSTALQFWLVKTNKNRYQGTLTVTTTSLKNYAIHSVVIEKAGPEWTLTMQHDGWNHSLPTIYTLLHGSANMLIFQCNYGESPNSLHFEFTSDNTVWLSCANIVDVGGEHGGQGLQYDRVE